MMTTLCVEDISTHQCKASQRLHSDHSYGLEVDVFPRPFDDNCVFWSETEFCIKIVTGCASTMSCV